MSVPERLQRCASNCLSPYPQPLQPKRGVKQTVPPCRPRIERTARRRRQSRTVAQPGDVAVGDLVHDAAPGVRHSARMHAPLPPAFEERRFAELLHGYAR